MKTVHHTVHEEDAYPLCYDSARRELRPQLVFTDPDGRTLFEINEAGLKGDPVDPARKLAVIWGDSVAFGARRGWPCLVDRLAPGWQFLNGGIVGDPYDNILRRARHFNERQPVALNLVMPGWHPFPDNATLRAMLSDFVRERPKTVLLTMPTAMNRHLADRDLSAFFTDRFARDPFTFLGTLEYSVELQATGFRYILERNAIVREVAAEQRIRLVDLYAEFDTERVENFRRDFHDMIHPRPSVYPRIAQAVYEGISDLLDGIR